MKKYRFAPIIILSIILAACSVGNVSDAISSGGAGTAELTDTYDGGESFETSSHASTTDPDYAVVFPQDEVNRIDIIISTEEWETMQADMIQLYGEAGTGNERGRMAPDVNGMPEDGAPGEVPPAGQNAPEGRAGAGEVDRIQPGRGVGGIDIMGSSQNPTWVEATIQFNGEVWEHVGIRYKGNSTLRTAWSSGSQTLPFKIDFDQYEDDYPETEDQRFFGFKQLTLANNAMDSSFLREVTAGEVFSEAGLVIAESALYEVYLDHGEGPEYLGLYTMVEVVEDTVLETAFGDDDGNIYKAEGSGSSFAYGTRNQLGNSFDRENNEEGEWTDLEELYDILHDSRRLEDPSAWRADLESALNVETFLNWLAVTTLTQDWDTYGNMSHNYYLYHNPDTDLLEWIAWDKSWAFSDNGGMRPALAIDLDDVSGEWPLIRFLMDDPVYKALYDEYLLQALDTAFNPEIMESWYQEMAELIAPYAEREVGDQAFTRAVQELINQAYSQYEAALNYLSD